MVDERRISLVAYGRIALFVAALAAVNPVFASPTYTHGVRPDGFLGVYQQSSYYQLEVGTRLADGDRYEQAIPYLEKAVEGNPTSVMAQYNLAYSLMQTAEETTSPESKQQLLARAEWAFLRVRDLNPDLALTYYKLGKLALGRGDYQAACDYYQSGVNNNPENFALLFNLAAAYEKLGDLAHAEKAYVKATEVNPKFVYAHNNLGLLYEQTNRPDKAEAIYREAMAQVPEYNYARLNLGSLLQGQGRLEEAVAVYQDAIGYESDNAWAYLYLGNTYLRQSRFHAAWGAYQKAIELNPEYPAAYYFASLALQHMNRPDEALAKSLQYIHLAPDGAYSQEAGELILTLQEAKTRAVNIEGP